MKDHDFDYIIIGSGFGGSVSAMRLTEKGYRVLVVEKGKRFKAEDFPKSNWNFKRFFWLPGMRFHGIFRMTFLRHITVLSGVGVGGGSLMYSNTLPFPPDQFFNSKSWNHLADWKSELTPYYKSAQRMLGTASSPRRETGDLVLEQIAKDIGKEGEVQSPEVAVFFGEPEQTVPDPYFDGEGPERAGCNFCGGCHTGCRYNAKNTLDKNYLYFAEKYGATILPETEVYDVAPNDGKDGETGYTIRWRSSTKIFKEYGEFSTKGIIFAGGVLGTIPLLLDLKESSLPEISKNLGNGIRTNSESLVGVTTMDKDTVFSDGIAISSILNTDEHSHIEPVRYSPGNGFWRLLQSPLVSGKSLISRVGKILLELILHPIDNLRVYFVKDWSRSTQILLFMQTLDNSLRFSKGWFGLRSSVEEGEAPSAFIPESIDLSMRFAEKVNGKPRVLLTETLFGTPTTAHILGGAVMGNDSEEGVIDKDHHVFGYKNMLICDGSTISANPGVNPALTITALTERAMSNIPNKLDID